MSSIPIRPVHCSMVMIAEPVYQQWVAMARAYATYPGNAPNYHDTDGTGLEVVLLAALDALRPLLHQTATGDLIPGRLDVPKSPKEQD